MMRTAVITLVNILALGAPAYAQPYGDGHMDRGWGWGNGWGHMFGGGILMIAFWAAIIALTVYLVFAVLRRTGRDGDARGSGGGGGGRSALDILEARYARGEIDRDEYETRRQDLLRDRQR